MNLALAAGTTVIVALLAVASGALTPRGAAAAAVVGSAVLWSTGGAGAAALLAFFVSGTALSRFLPDPAAQRGEAKGARRDAGQVFANGGAAALAGLIALGRPTLAIWAITASLAAASADTWATAIGATSPRPPRHLMTGAPVAAGQSGGVTLRGTIAAMFGALVVAAAAALVTRDLRFLIAVTVVGWIGMVADSALGATVQGRFVCPACAVDTERTTHRCGTRTTPAGGWRWLTNDGVNAIATGTGAMLGAAAWCWVGVGPR